MRRQDPSRRPSGVTRAALYSTYLHLKEEFERRRDRLREAGVIADPRDAQIDWLEEQIRHLSSGCQPPNRTTPT